MTTTAIITRDDVKAFMGVATFDTELDAQLDQLIYTASELIEEAISQELASSAVTDYFGTVDTNKFTVDLFGGSESGVVSSAYEQRFRLTRGAVDTGEDMDVYYDLSRLWPAASSIVDTDYWYYDADTNSVVLQVATARASRSIKITYTAGYAVTAAAGGVPANLSASAPSDLKVACITQVLFMLDKIRSGSLGVTSQQEDGQPYSSRGFMCEEVAQLISPYKPLLLGRG